MAKYTITLTEARALMTPEQTAREAEIFNLIDDVVYRETVKRVYFLKYSDYEISNGTPLGYLNDFEKYMLLHRDEINSLLATVKKGNYYDVVYKELEIADSGEDTDTRTPNLTTTSGSTSKLYDTPDTPNPDQNRFIASVSDINANTSERGSETTTREYGKKTTHTRTIPPKALFELIAETPRSVLEYILGMFAHCFMLIY